MTKKEYLFDRLERQANISVYKYVKKNYVSAAAYFHSAAELGIVLEDCFKIQPGDSKYFINIMRKCCDYWGVNYNSYFDKMCEYAYEEG